MPLWWSYSAALMLTVAGSFAAARFSGLAAAVLHLEPAPLHVGLLAFWTLPSVCFCLLFPLLHRLSAADQRERIIPMRVPQFLDLVPKAVKAGVFIIVGCALLIGVAVSIGGRNHGRISAHGASLSVLSAIAAKGLGFGLLAGVLVATWAVCLGYV